MYRLVLRAVFPLAFAFTVMVAPAYASNSPNPVKIQIKDKCDPVTFNAAVGPGTCIGNGSVTFAHFVDEVNRLQRAPQWEFSPSQRRLNVGQSFTATNTGGESHTFTEVDQFGGGVVPFLNQAAGFPTLAPECTDGSSGNNGPLLNFAPKALASLVMPGGFFHDTETANDVGHPVLYQCCIHPWMHAVLTVNP